jgi:glycosyltransferase involved in cell wall biosynthesis
LTTAAAGARERVPVMLLIGSLEHGGAQRQLVELARHLDPGRFEPFVCSLSATVPLAAALPPGTELAVTPRRWRFDPLPVVRVARLMRRRRVRLVHAFLFDAEMVARLAAPLAGVRVVVGSERNSNYRRPGLQRWCLRRTRRWVSGVIANSHAGKAFHVATVGPPAERVWVVHNGVDVERFRPGDRAAARRELGLPPTGHVIGMVASFKPQKNHFMLLDVARRLRDRWPDVRFVCAGEELPGARGGTLAAGTGSHRGVDEYYRRVLDTIAAQGLGESVRLLGALERVERLYAACDLTVLTSDHEGTPNVLLESMACGVPVVATDVGDNAHLVPDRRVGALVPRGDAEAMAAEIERLLVDPRRLEAAGAAARAWVEREFSTAALAARTGRVYEDLLRESGPRPPAT